MLSSRSCISRARIDFIKRYILLLMFEELDFSFVHFILLQSKKRTVWDHYNKKSSLLATCNECSQDIKRKTGNTTGLIRHLRNKHKLELNTNIVKNKGIYVFLNCYD